MKPVSLACLLFILGSEISLFGQKPEPPTNQPPSMDYTFSIKSSPAWTDTGLDLNAGDRVHIYGPITTCEGPELNQKAHLIVSSAPAGALLAKLHLEADAIPASPDADVPVINPSRLYLAVNGLNCHGRVPVKVQVERR